MAALRTLPFLLVTATLFVSAAAAQPRTRYESDLLNLTFGVVEVFDDVADQGRFGLEYRARALSRLKVVPALGYAHAFNGANFVYIDARRDFWMGDRWVVIPSFGLGSFDDSAEVDLGNQLEFRSGVEVAVRPAGDYRVGVALFHISNGGFSDRNPGTEVLVVSLCIPLSSNN